MKGTRLTAKTPSALRQEHNYCKMQELLTEIAKGLVEAPDAVNVTVDETPNEDGYTVYHLHVAQDDMGRVIGKHGKIAKAIRTVVKATAARANMKVQVEID